MTNKCEACGRKIIKRMYKIHITKRISIGEELIKYMVICEKCKSKILKLLKGV